MLKFEKRQYWKVGLISAIVSFIMIFVGIKGILGNDLNLRNIMVYAIFSVLVGVVSAALLFWNLKIAFWGLMAGLVIGFFQMYRAFIDGMSGWGDLVGMMYLFTLIIIGLGAGIIAQFGYYLYKRNKR